MTHPHRLILAAALAATALASSPVRAGVNVGVSIGFSQPGLWGGVQIGPYPMAPIIAPRPVVIAPPPPPAVVVPGPWWTAPPAITVPAPIYRWAPYRVHEGHRHMHPYRVGVGWPPYAGPRY